MDKKKLAAAIAAVFAHIKTTEEAMAQAAMLAQEPEAAAADSRLDTQPANLWGVTGRQNQMQANTMMLMRAFK